MTASLPTPIKSSFDAVANADTRVLILGSLPGEESLARSQYYANPRNQFWRLMGAVVGTDFVELAYPARLEALSRAGVGLWDVVRSARRTGSLDVNIRGHTTNAIAAFAASLPSLRAVAFNGAKAFGLGHRLLADNIGHSLVALPSSSPAHTMPFARKAERWSMLRTFLDGPP